MRPLKLTMQAFGVYLDKFTIPFENLGQNNIYLITGVTGSGKTTIFDAISFALFNSSSGENRGNAALRSHFAKDSVESFVEFEFQHNLKTYKILRTPSYQRKKLRGEGFILENSKAQITLPDGKIIIGVKEVNEFVEDLLGINARQFSQIALLAQGDFLKLLNCDTQTRGEIFRNIFKTLDFSMFQAKLKDETITLKKKYDFDISSLIQYISQIISSDEDLRLIIQENLSNNYPSQLDKLENLLENQNKNDEKEVKSFQKNILKLTNQKLEKQQLQDKITQLIQLNSQKDDFENKIEIAKKDFNIIEKDFLKLDDKNKKLNELSLEIKKLDEDYNNSIEIEKNEKLLLIEEENFNSNKNLIKNDEEKLIEIKNNYLQNTYNFYLKLKNNLENEQKNFKEIQKTYNEKLQNYNLIYNKYLSMQAGILAKNLVDNEPCPVCGSKVHPNPAKILDEEISKDYLENLKNDLEKVNENLSLNSQKCSVSSEKINLKFDEFENLKNRFSLNNFIFDEKNNEILEIDFEKNIKNISQNIEKLLEENNQINLKIENLKTKISTLEKNLKIKDKEKILSLHKELSLNFKNLEKEIEKIKKNYEENKINLAQLVSKNEIIIKQIKTFKNIKIDDFDLIKNEIKDLSCEIENQNSAFQKINSRFDFNKNILKSIQNKKKEFLETQEKYLEYKILNDTANGALKGKARIPFEQYIQGYYLDLVLNEANKRLLKLTQGQFQLLRKKDVSNLASKTGLELEVFDFYTYKKRSTKTLSGGESFKAALCLALGLSDCMTSSLGAINIDSLFIDEGFGTLDNESLELSMNLISNLSLNNRLIGIISHVESLKERIQNQIISIKTPLGSKIEVTF